MYFDMYPHTHTHSTHNHTVNAACASEWVSVVMSSAEVVCLPVADTIDDSKISTLWANNRVCAARLARLSGQPFGECPTFVDRGDGRIDLHVTSLPYRAAMLGGRFGPEFPATVFDITPPASIVMFSEAVQILGTRDERTAQLVIESLCHRLGKQMGINDLTFCNSYVCNMVSAFSLGHRLDLKRAARKLPKRRVVYDPRYFDGLEICMENGGKTGIKVTCIVFRTGSGVLTGGSSPQHHLDHIPTLVRLLYEFALPKDDGIAQQEAIKRKREHKLVMLPSEFMQRDASMPAPRTLPGMSPPGSTQKRTRRGNNGQPTAAYMTTLMNATYLPDVDPRKPFYTALPGRVVLPDPDKPGSVVYWMMARGVGGCEHQDRARFKTNSAGIPTCSVCDEVATKFTHSRSHSIAHDVRAVCSHLNCSLSLRQLSADVVVPECDMCGYIDFEHFVLDRRVSQQKRKAQSRAKSLLRTDKKVKKAKTIGAKSGSKTRFHISGDKSVRIRSTRQQVRDVMQDNAQASDGRDPYERLTMVTDDLLKNPEANQYVL